MTKLLVVLLVVAVALWALFARARGGRAGREPHRDAAPPAPAPDRSRAQDMVRCARCGVHLPAGDAVQAGGATYCSTEHASAGPGRP